jgi:undecaprenyl-diphosphatase
LEDIIQRDKELLTFLNNLGSEQWDPLWLAITNQLNWTPLFVLVIFLVFRSFGLKRGGLMIFAMILLVAFSDQFTNLIKHTFDRLRPNNDPEIKFLLRTMINPQGPSFMSGHATTSTFFSVFVILLLREKYKFIYCILIFPIVFAYSRLYLGIHFPIDILVGVIIGTVFANGYFWLFQKTEKRIFDKSFT